MRPTADLSEFVELLARRRMLQRIAVPVNPDLELAAIVRRVCCSPTGGKALLFERVGGCLFPVLVNQFGSSARVASAVAAGSLAEACSRLAALLSTVQGTAAERLALLAREVAPVAFPSAASSCREVQEVPDLRMLPALRAWPGDAGSYLSLPLVFTSDPDTGEGNCGIYRMQLFDEKSAGLHLRPGSDAARHLSAWARRRQPMPVAVALGGEPALHVAAAAPLPAGVDEVAFAGLLRGLALEQTPCMHSGLAVPARAEFVLEGEVEAGGGGST